MDHDTRQRLVARVSAANNVSGSLLEKLLDLEEEFSNLHAWGMRPALRRRIASVVDEELRASGISDK
ncbi:hypothetical protein M8997_011525 [Phyllobacterium sp. 21LDTY02-6]|uniref:hypothetical protein n=1 Tax=Phyllobacterium sp. 21LDTY02-6 TaxID=2944903 RepID=UPI0020228EC2|nr:hypothetical protein [Phyllobacterium sp. 21LDTY02-6]MCO4317812.1 hypothetical protein [Phyllobacterium sp. 21LDTY02-6]